MSALHLLKKHFVQLATKNGRVTDADYYRACHGIKDTALLDALGTWLVKSNIQLVAVGLQYQKEVMQKVMNPSVEDIKDTKSRTHKNKDKLQKSKKKEQASKNLNNLIDRKKDSDDEFLPSWRRFQAQLAKDPEFVRFLASVGITAIDWRRPDEVQPAVAQLVESYMQYINENAVPESFPEMQPYLVRVDPQEQMPLASRLLAAIPYIEDTGILRETMRRIYSGNQGEFETGPQSPSPQQVMEPEQEFDLDLGDDAPLELASKLHKKSTVVFDGGVRFVAHIADTPVKLAKGLEVISALPKNAGMLFPFDPPDHVTFHMGNVEYPIDIIFLLEGDNAMQVGKIVPNAQPGSVEYWSYPKTAAVLEIAGGLCAEHGIKVGSLCTLRDRFEL
jgi:uncharacterized membrane protein (UPF0127 family)